MSQQFNHRTVNRIPTESNENSIFSICSTRNIKKFSYFFRLIRVNSMKWMIYVRVASGMLFLQFTFDTFPFAQPFTRCIVLMNAGKSFTINPWIITLRYCHRSRCVSRHRHSSFSSLSELCLDDRQWFNHPRRHWWLREFFKLLNTREMWQNWNCVKLWNQLES